VKQEKIKNFQKKKDVQPDVWKTTEGFDAEDIEIVL